MAEYMKGINPAIIKWARERSGYTLEEVANSLNKDVETISNWESGSSAPTYAQLEKLADKCKRPIALFFFPEVPQEPDLVKRLALRSSEIEALSPNIRLLLRHAAARQISLMELNMGVNPAESRIFRDLQARLDDSVTDLARRTREYLDINVETQASWSDSTTALEIWRDCIEDKGIFVFKDAFQNEFVDGFSLVHDQFPVIYLNNSRLHVRQIFSLLHELAHLLLGANGITRVINPEGGRIERFCNQFAAEFLVPSSDLETRLDFPNYDDTAIGKLASHYKVSRPVILLKLIDQGLLKPADFKQKTKNWKEAYEFNLEKTAESKKSGGGDYYNTRAIYLGYRFMNLAFSRYHQGGCSIEELAGHLNVKVKNLPGLEDPSFEEGYQLMAYVFDTNSFRVLGNYYPNQFPTFWRQFNQAAINGKIISVREAQRELESQVHPPLSDWVKHQRHIFMEPRPFEIQFVSEIFSVPHFLNLVNKKNQLTGRPCADPFIIAKAKFIDGCVVTEETLKPNAAKIPNVCEHFKIDCTNLQGFMEREGWTF